MIQKWMCDDHRDGDDYEDAIYTFKMCSFFSGFCCWCGQPYFQVHPQIQTTRQQ